MSLDLKRLNESLRNLGPLPAAHIEELDRDYYGTSSYMYTVQIEEVVKARMKKQRKQMR